MSQIYSVLVHLCVDRVILTRSNPFSSVLAEKLDLQILYWNTVLVWILCRVTGCFFFFPFQNCSLVCLHGVDSEWKKGGRARCLLFMPWRWLLVRILIFSSEAYSWSQSWSPPPKILNYSWKANYLWHTFGLFNLRCQCTGKPVELKI